MAKYKIEIDGDLCVGDGACCEEAPNTFVLDEDEVATVTDPEGDPPETILEAAKSCPTEAIIIYDAETGEKIWPE
ncbi:MAG: ferredoxin [Acidobacteriota bacterium]|nr:MAG: ferredoxin [Acidobacteriota bacterium]